MASTLSADFHLRSIGSLYLLWGWYTCIYLALAHTTRLEKIQGSVGLGLEQEEEPTVVDETTTYSHCGEGLCWSCLWEFLVVNVWGGGCIAEHWWHSLSVGAFLGSVSMWYHGWITGITWNLRSRLRKSPLTQLKTFLSTSTAMKIILFCLITFFSKYIVQLLMDIHFIQVISFESFILKCSFNLQNSSAACEKLMAIASCLASTASTCDILLQCVIFHLILGADLYTVALYT